jgi:hypothetical protein
MNLSGIVGLGLMLAIGAPAAAGEFRSPLPAEVRVYNGAPTVFLAGRPVFYGAWWGSPPRTDGWDQAGFAASEAAAVGIHVYAFDIGPQEWAGPGPGRSADYDLSTLRARFDRVIAADPLACFHLRIYLEMNEAQSGWWLDRYPREREIASDGAPGRQSLASTVWREQAKAFLRALVGRLKSDGLFERVVAYQVGTGHTGEWVKGRLSMLNLTGDYSEPMACYFRSWLRARYGSDEALRTAWNDSGVSLETAVVPPRDAQLTTRHLVFRDPKAEQNVIDYFRALADLSGDLVIDFCRTVKEATGRQALAGAFFGYLMELAWNAGFFSEGPPSDYSTYQRSGHLGLARVLDSPEVDFLVSPYGYGFRGIGGEGCPMPPAESLRLHGKFYVMEDDTRTHTDDQPAFGRARNLDETTAILRRNFGSVVTRGEGVWWLLAKGHIDAEREPAFEPLLRRFREIGDLALETDRSPAADIAVLLDDESFYYETVRNDLDLPLIFEQRLFGLPRMGAAYAVYLLDDFLAGRLKPYKLYIFLNAFRLDGARRDALKRELRRDGRVALWIYAPGYIKDGPSVENMADLTGFRFGRNDNPWPASLHFTDFDHPISRELPQDLFWGTDSRLGPLFYVEDADARILGDAVLSLGMCRAGFAVKTFPEWTSIYCAVPNLPAAVLRAVARFAGAHIYNDQGDVLSASRNLLSVHTVSGGRREFRLPGRVELVYDLFVDKIVAEHCERFEADLAPVSTRLFYIGDRKAVRPAPPRDAESFLEDGRIRKGERTMADQDKDIFKEIADKIRELGDSIEPHFNQAGEKLRGFHKAVQPSLSDLGKKFQELGQVVGPPAEDFGRRMKDWAKSVRPVVDDLGRRMKDWKNADKDADKPPRVD